MTDEVPTPALLPAIASRLKRDEHGLFAAIAQQHDTGEVLMLAWMDDEALRRTLTSGRVTYWSRSRREYWTKGDTSGNVQILKAAALDCDGDAVLLKVDQSGGACHTGDRTCFDAGALPLGAAAEASGEGNEGVSTDGSPDSPSAARGPLGESAA
ncbi:phosphoribosyl-AMP cyclohydrolase [Catenulispora sp. GAS73]|uniref:phosphoribosyl-AMP cyclohydrolase n=1 Tax=Catenulispora sp. GAS73 TaxID=3156269 RepID=UPI0035192237